MKNYKIILCLTAVALITACSKDDDNNVYVKAPSAKIEVENLNAVPLFDAMANNVSSAVAESKITVTNEGTIGDGSKVTVNMDLAHTFASDLVIQIVSPTGESCTLLKRALSGTDDTSSDFIAGNLVAFNAAAAGEIAAVEGVISTGVYLPTAGLNTAPANVELTNLGDFFNGKSIKGDWSIKVTDYSPADTGTLNKWKITFETGALQ